MASLTIDISLGNEDIAEELIRAYTVMTSGSWDKKSTLLELNYLTNMMADTLFFSYYDVMLIQTSYLIIWSKSDSSTRVPIVSLFSIFDPQYHGMLSAYFKNGTLTSNEYFIFVCLYSFFDFRQIVTVMVAMGRIYSNLFITQNQITTFVRTFSLAETIRNNLSNFLSGKETERNDTGYTYTIRDFLFFLNNDEEFKSFICHFQDAVRFSVFSEKDYKIITDKINFYYSHRKDDVVPTESCSSKFFRKLLTKRPSPYSFNFGLINCTEKSKENVIYTIKQSYGYGSRISNAYSLTPSGKIIQSNHNFSKCSSSGRARSRTNTLCYADFVMKPEKYEQKSSLKNIK